MRVDDDNNNDNGTPPQSWLTKIFADTRTNATRKTAFISPFVGAK